MSSLLRCPWPTPEGGGKANPASGGMVPGAGGTLNCARGSAKS